ncbi:sugar transferase [Phormidesmis priestleyi ULC007]|uniref:Sugar transferase n=2 Tax=Phormidesmis priestleyi TaxID=268141 RepID=A0A2T1DI90_9CYAN|nr:sugar transferase [Phormidesmis priestleyi ULC007]PZO49081.1 MAG: sugar transferase [Phormidesmis priestleyi]
MSPEISSPSYSILLDCAQESEISAIELASPVELEVLHSSAHNKLKRLIDIVGAVVGLGITAIVAVPLAIAIQRDNPGPVFYSQTRCGVKGKPFRIWKFRSMVADAEQRKHLVENQAKGHIFKNENDPRITRVGAFLRRTSLDELPQFWNVLKGEMSLVGTRPPTLDEVKKYQPHHWVRLNVKPGMTGEWQVNGRSSVIDFEDVVKLDVAYQQKWSIAYDLRLIISTIEVVFKKRGAC